MSIIPGLSFSLSTGIAFECAFSGDKSMPLFQKMLLSISVILLVPVVTSRFIQDGGSSKHKD